MDRMEEMSRVGVGCRGNDRGEDSHAWLHSLGALRNASTQELFLDKAGDRALATEHLRKDRRFSRFLLYFSLKIYNSVTE